MCTQGAYLTLVQKVGQQKDELTTGTGSMSTIQVSRQKKLKKCRHQHFAISQMMYVNCYNTLPVFLITFCILGNPTKIWQYPHLFGETLALFAERLYFYCLF